MQKMLNTIQSKDNPKIKYAQKLAKDAKFRFENGEFFASTPKVVMDILKAGFAAESLFMTQKEYDRFADKLEDEKNTAPQKKKLTDYFKLNF